MGGSLLERIQERPLVTDGAMGTMLQAAGLKSGACGEEWNVTHRAEVQAIHRAYLEAGSDIALANTFGANRFRLKEYGKEKEVARYNRAAAELAKEVAEEFDALVLGDMGPSGQMLAPLGTASEEELFEAFQEQARALVEGGVDGLIVETMTTANELAVAVRAARSMGTLPILASVSYNPAKDSYRTMMGETVAYCVEQALAAGADIVGTNCGIGIEDMTRVVREIRAATERPIIAQPNAGLPEVVEGKVIYRQTPEAMAERVPALLEAGARLVGGCCGTNPAFIRLAKAKVLEAS